MNLILFIKFNFIELVDFELPERINLIDQDFVEVF